MARLNMHRDPTDTLDLTSAEMVCLLQNSSDQNRVRVEEQLESGLIPDEELDRARQSLIDRGLFNRSGKVKKKYQAALAPLFMANRILLMIKNIPNTGRQTLAFLWDDHTVISYSSTLQGVNRLEVIRSESQLVDLITGWFQLNSYEPAERQLIISTDLFKKVHLLSREGRISDALAILKDNPGSLLEWEQLLNAMHKPALSGSLALLENRDGAPTETFSLAFLKDDRTAWHLSCSDPVSGVWTIDRDSHNLAGLIDRIVQRFFGGEMLDAPLDKENVVTFSLTADELALCLININAPAPATGLLKAAYPEESDQQLAGRISQAGVTLLSRGWCIPSPTGNLRLAARLEMAVFPLVKYHFIAQAEITRPQLHALATIHILNKRFFTSVLRPDDKTYVLEHGDVTALAMYVAKLFLDFGTGSKTRADRKHAIQYNSIANAMSGSGKAQINTLIEAGLENKIAILLADDLSNSLYRGSLIRVNTGSDEHKPANDLPVKSSLLLLKSATRSWLFEFPPGDETNGQLSLVDRSEFEKILTAFFL
jgi:hypothetical protein